MRSPCSWCKGSGSDTSADGKHQIECGTCGGSGLNEHEDKKETLNDPIIRVVSCLCKALQCPKCFRLPLGGRYRVLEECLAAVSGADEERVRLALDLIVADRACRCETIL